MRAFRGTFSARGVAMCAATALAAASGCADVLVPKRQAVVPSSRPRASVVATSSLPSEVTAGAVGVAPERLLVTSRAGWSLLLRATGTLGVTQYRNEFFDPGSATCVFDRQYTVGARARGGDLQLRVAVRNPLVATDTSRHDAGPVWYAAGWYGGWPTDQPNSYVTLISFPKGSPLYNVYVWRNGLPRTRCHYRNDFGEITSVLDPSVTVGGAQQVEASYLKLDVTASTTRFAPGETIRFTAQPLQFTPVETSGFPMWRFASRDPVWGSDTGTDVPACSGSWTCDYAPTTRGVMVAQAVVVNAALFDRTDPELVGPLQPVAIAGQSDTIAAAAPRIGVICAPATVTRAASTPVTCTASATGGTLAISGWTFAPTDPAVGGVSSTQTTLTWQGTAVASGAVTVQGTVGGLPASSDTGRISVVARPGWTWRADTSLRDAPAGTLECNPARHFATGLFGWVTADSTCRNTSLMLWPDPDGVSSKRGWTVAQVPGGPNRGLWYVTGDRTGMRLRAQVLKDLRPDGWAYSIGGRDTVNARCGAAGVRGNSATVTVVNNTCMADPSPLNFASLYAFAWRHERCHLQQARNVFPTIPDPRTKLETIVRPDTAALNFEAVSGAGGYFDANDAILNANTIDVPSPNTYTLWSRNTANTAWLLRGYQPRAILAAGC